MISRDSPSECIAISNYRILAFDGENVSFAWKDRKHNNEQKVESLPATRFLERFIQHVVPRRFVRIRYFGFLSNPVRRRN